MANNFAVKLTSKERELRGFVRLVRESGAVLSSYCSLALRSYLEQNRFLKIATVLPEKTEESININLYFDEELAGILSDYMEKRHIRNRSKLIKMILSMSIQVGSLGEEKLASEFELHQDFYALAENMPVSGTDRRKAEIKPEMKAEPRPEVRQNPRKSDILPEKSAPENKDSMAEEDDAEPVQDLLTNLFPGIGSRMEKW